MTSLRPRKERKHDKTIQNIQVDLKVVGLPWRAGKITSIEPLSKDEKPLRGFSHGDWFAGVSLITQDKLPHEFFLHQLMDVNLDDKDDLFQFLSKWGFPYHPLRNDNTVMSEYERISDTLKIREKRDPDIQKARKAIRLTNSIKKTVQAEGLDVVISEEEALITLELLKSISIEIQSAVLEQKPLSRRTIRIINASTSSEKVLAPGNGSLDLYAQQLGLTNGIANQIVDTINDPADWYQCDSSNCNRLFKRKQCASQKPSSASIYCSDTCKNYAVTNDRRKRIDHGR